MLVSKEKGKRRKLYKDKFYSDFNYYDFKSVIIDGLLANNGCPLIFDMHSEYVGAEFPNGKVNKINPIINPLYLEFSEILQLANINGKSFVQERYFRKAFNLAKEVWNDKTSALTEKEKYAKTIMFPIGEENTAYAKYFIGQSYLAPISTSQVKMYNVTFEPKCRNNWHIHHAKSGGGQMLIVVCGRGYYQEWGKEPQELNVGDVVNIPANVKHWHGAAPDSWFSHLAVEVDGIETSNEWLEPVEDSEYNKLK